MLTQRAANIVFAFLTVAACAFFAALARKFEFTGFAESTGLTAKFFPQLILGFAALCAVIVAAMYAFRGSAGGDDGQMVFADAGDARRGILTLAVAVLCYAVWVNVGFVLMAALMGPLSLLAMGVRSARIYVAVLVLAAFVYGVFTQLLGVQLT